MSLRRIFLAAAASSLFLPLAAQDRPNVIFVMVDDLGFGDLGVFYQNQRGDEPRIFTPQLDSMAKEGLALWDHYSAAPVCAPARGSLLSGMHQGHANVRDNQFDKALENNQTLGTLMQSLGYATAAVGKWGLQGQGNSAETWDAYPTKRGFDEFFGYVAHKDGHCHYPKEGEVNRSPSPVWWNDEEISDRLDHCYTTDLWTAYAKHWVIEQHETAPDQPFFLYLAFDAPHATTSVPTMDYPEGSGLSGGMQWSGEAGSAINTAIQADGSPAQNDSWIQPDYREYKWPEIMSRYATMVSRIDAGVGDLLATLDELGIGDNTLVVFTSDNGPSVESYMSGRMNPEFFESFGPFDGIKRDCWEGGVREPTIVRWPAGIMNPGRDDHNPSQFHDWMPTLAELGGGLAPARSDGSSLMPVLRGEQLERRSPVYVEYTAGGSTPSFQSFAKAHRGRKRGQMQMIREENFVGVRYNVQHADDAFEIYDVAADPGQRDNLAANQRELQQRFQKQVRSMRRIDSSARRPYDQAPVPAETESGENSWYAMAGDFPWVPSFESVQFTASGGKCSALEACQQAQAKGANALLFDTWISVPETGAYHFTFSCNGRAIVRLADCLLIDADFGYESGSEVDSGPIWLEAGLHSLTISSVLGEGKPELELSEPIPVK